MPPDGQTLLVALKGESSGAPEAEVNRGTAGDSSRQLSRAHAGNRHENETGLANTAALRPVAAARFEMCGPGA